MRRNALQNLAPADLVAIAVRQRVVEVVDALDQLHGRASDAPVLLEGQHGTGLDDALAVGPFIDTVGEAGERHGVGDEDSAVGVGVVGDGEGGGRQVDEVGD